MDLTLTQLFGEGASQTSANLTIQKSSLSALTVAADNRGEQLLAAIVNTAAQAFVGYLTDENGNSVTSETGESVDYRNSYLYIDLFLWSPYPKNQKIIHQFVTEFLEPYAD